jgi:hypothetical protein
MNKRKQRKEKIKSRLGKEEGGRRKTEVKRNRLKRKVEKRRFFP